MEPNYCESISINEELKVQFQDILCKAKEIRRKPFGHPFDTVSIKWLCVYFTSPKGVQFQCSITDIFFSDSGFLDMIEWKELNNEEEYIINSGLPMYHNDIGFHKMRLSILDSDEERIRYVLDNMKGLVKE